jgi:hypothetical protein
MGIRPDFLERKKKFLCESEKSAGLFYIFQSLEEIVYHYFYVFIQISK